MGKRLWLEQHQYNITGLRCIINSVEFYVSLVPLSINKNIRFLKHSKQRFKRTIYLNKYRSEITTQQQTI